MITSIEKLEHAIVSLDSFRTSVYLEQNECIREALVTCEQKNTYIVSSLFESPGCLVSSRHKCNTLQEAFMTLVKLQPGAEIFHSSLIVDVNNQQGDEIIARLASDAWSAAFLQRLELSANDNSSRHDILKNNLWRKLSGGGAEGVKKWNARPLEGARIVDWSESNLSGLQLEGVELSDLNFDRANFSHANLNRANLFRCQLQEAIICGANLSKANLSEANLERANFKQSFMKQSKLKKASLRNASFDSADLSNADLSWSDLRGADLASAITTDANFDQARYDDTTKLPAIFSQWSRLRWNGSSADPYQEAVKTALSGARKTSFEEWLAFLQGRFEGKNISNALKMLKKNRYRLFAVVESTSFRGVIKSQKDPNTVYGCSLAESGEWICGTEDLMLCDSAKTNEVCKHILVLAIGLAHARNMDLAVIARWLFAGKKPNKRGDGSALAEVFLYYKASTANDLIDWRPTETIPEDYYAF
jgi:uncharacterized protein YjbI with pentapeptide repeats